MAREQANVSIPGTGLVAPSTLRIRKADNHFCADGELWQMWTLVLDDDTPILAGTGIQTPERSCPAAA